MVWNKNLYLWVILPVSRLHGRRNGQPFLGWGVANLRHLGAWDWVPNPTLHPSTQLTGGQRESFSIMGWYISENNNNIKTLWLEMDTNLKKNCDIHRKVVASCLFKSVTLTNLKRWLFILCWFVNPICKRQIRLDLGWVVEESHRNLLRDLGVSRWQGDCFVELKGRQPDELIHPFVNVWSVKVDELRIMTNCHFSNSCPSLVTAHLIPESAKLLWCQKHELNNLIVDCPFMMSQICCWRRLSQFA